MVLLFVRKSPIFCNATIYKSNTVQHCNYIWITILMSKGLSGLKNLEFWSLYVVKWPKFKWETVKIFAIPELDRCILESFLKVACPDADLYWKTWAHRATETFVFRMVFRNPSNNKSYLIPLVALKKKENISGTFTNQLHIFKRIPNCIKLRRKGSKAVK